MRHPDHRRPHRNRRLLSLLPHPLLTTSLAVGVAVGLPLAYALARLLGDLIFGVGSTDLAAFAGAIAALAAAALLAGYLPARRAARIDPVETLRAE